MIMDVQEALHFPHSTLQQPHEVQIWTVIFPSVQSGPHLGFLMNFTMSCDIARAWLYWTKGKLTRLSSFPKLLTPLSLGTASPSAEWGADLLSRQPRMRSQGCLWQLCSLNPDTPPQRCRNRPERLNHLSKSHTNSRT